MFGIKVFRILTAFHLKLNLPIFQKLNNRSSIWFNWSNSRIIGGNSMASTVLLDGANCVTSDTTLASCSSVDLMKGSESGEETSDKKKVSEKVGSKEETSSGSHMENSIGRKCSGKKNTSISEDIEKKLSDNQLESENKEDGDLKQKKQLENTDTKDLSKKRVKTSDEIKKSGISLKHRSDTKIPSEKTTRKESDTRKSPDKSQKKEMSSEKQCERSSKKEPNTKLSLDKSILDTKISSNKTSMDSDKKNTSNNPEKSVKKDSNVKSRNVVVVRPGDGLICVADLQHRSTKRKAEDNEHSSAKLAKPSSSHGSGCKSTDKGHASGTDQNLSKNSDKPSAVGIKFPSNVHPDLMIANELVYMPCGLPCTSKPVQEAESQGYGAYDLSINRRQIKFRVAKVTPTKNGQFVTFWKRIGNGPIQPYDSSDPVDLFVVSVHDGKNFGQFVFPKKVLIERGVMSKAGKGGKRAIRVYPPWVRPESQQATSSQGWQTKYFFSISEKTVDKDRARRLYAAL